MTEPTRPQTETYPHVMSGLADHLHRRGQYEGATAAERFAGKRTTWDAENPVRVVSHEGGGYQIAVVVDGRYFDLEGAQRAANLQRHLLNLLWLDQLVGPEAERLRDEEVERYAKWSIGPDEEEEGR